MAPRAKRIGDKNESRRVCLCMHFLFLHETTSCAGAKKEFLEGPNTNTDFLLVALLSAGRGRSRNFNANVGSSSIYLSSIARSVSLKGRMHARIGGPKKAYSPPFPLPPPHGESWLRPKNILLFDRPFLSFRSVRMGWMREYFLLSPLLFL